MGKANNVSNNGLEGINQAEGNGQQGEGGNSTASNHSNTKPTAQRGGRGRGTRGNTSTEKELLGATVVEVETPQLTPEEIAKKEKRKEQQRLSAQKRRAEKKAGQGKAPKNNNAAKPKMDNQQLNILIQTFSMIVASREGMSHWALQPDEIEQITKPLMNILSKYEGVGETFGQYADHIALLMACGTIIVPRLIIQFQQSKAKKGMNEIDKHRTKPREGSTSNNTGEVNTNSRPNAGQSSDNNTLISKELSSILPVVGY